MNSAHSDICPIMGLCRSSLLVILLGKLCNYSKFCENCVKLTSFSNRVRRNDKQHIPMTDHMSERVMSSRFIWWFICRTHWAELCLKNGELLWLCGIVVK